MACLTGIGLVWLAGCDNRAGGAPQPTTLRIAVGGTAARDGIPLVTTLLFSDPLLSLDIDGRPSARLAKAWEWSADGRQLFLHLRPGVTFHDGTPLTAALVAEVLRNRLEQQRNRRPIIGFQHVEAVAVVGALEIAVRLSRPDAFLLGALSDASIVRPSAPDVGTGPFRLVSREPEVRAEKFSGYYQGEAGVDQVQMITYDTQRSAWAAMMRGEAEMVQEVARESVEFLEGASDVRTYTSVRPHYLPFVFNLKHPILSRPEVRRAISQAIDREEIVAKGMRGHGRVADGPIWPFHWAYSANDRSRSYNPEAAAITLDAAGYPMPRITHTGARMTSRFRLTCHLPGDVPEFERIALILQRQLAGVGIDLTLVPASQAEMGERAATGNFETYLYQMLGGRSFDWTFRFWRSAHGDFTPFQRSGYDGADGALDQLRHATSDIEIRRAVNELQQRFYEDTPAAFLAWIEVTRAAHSDVHLGPPNDPDILAAPWRWRAGARPQALR